MKKTDSSGDSDTRKSVDMNEPIFENDNAGDLYLNSFDAFSIPVFITTQDFLIYRANSVVRAQLNQYPETLTGKSIFEVFKFRYAGNIASLKNLIENSPDQVSTFAQAIYSEQVFNIQINPLHSQDGNFYLFQLIDTNNLSIDPLNYLVDTITGKENQTFLSTGFNNAIIGELDNSFLKTIIDSLPHPFYVIETVTNNALVRNHAAIKFEASLESVHCYMKEKPESCIGNAYICALKMVISSTTPIRVEHEFFLKSGEKRVHEVFGYPVFNIDGSLKFVIQYSIDITDRKRNEVELHEYQAVLDNLMNNLPGMAFRCLNEVNWTMEYVSPGCKKLTGYNSNELINNKKTHYGDLIYSEDRKAVWDDIQQAVNRHRVYRIEYRIVTKNGKLKWVLEQGRGVFDKFDKLVRLEGLVTDITEGKNAETLLKTELAINQGIATIGVELLKDTIKPARVAFLVQQYSRFFTGSAFSILISPASEGEKSYIYNYDENNVKEISGRIRRHESSPGKEDGLIEQLLTEQQPTIVNESGIKARIPCIKPGEFAFNRMMSVPAFINNQYAGIIILANAENDYTENMVGIVQRYINMFALAAYRLKAEESLQLAKEKAEESDRLKSLFLSNMSHEIRTPMNAILGFAEMLQDSGLSIDEKDRFLDVIIKSGDNLLRLINDIIDISKIEAGQLKIIYSDCYLNEMFTDLEVFFNQELVRFHKDHITLYMQPGNFDKEFTVNTDPVRLRQILTNLAGNAFKFTDEGFIEIGYNIRNDMLEFYVRDSGIGIPIDQQKIIFERFGQVREASSHNLSGTGLGLTISRNLVEMLGGEMWLDSYPGEGSTFWFTIPLKTGRNHIVHNTESDLTQSPHLDLSGKFLLVVEDVDTNYFYISALLEKLNGNVLRADDGAKAVEICKTNPEIHLVLMDIELPVLDGYTATREIKKIRSDLPIIAQTAFAMMGERERCIEAGCDDYIAKPIRKEVLIGIISRFL